MTANPINNLDIIETHLSNKTGTGWLANKMMNLYQSHTLSIFDLKA
jgi:hypothetical protein